MSRASSEAFQLIKMCHLTSSLINQPRSYLSALFLMAVTLALASNQAAGQLHHRPKNLQTSPSSQRPLNFTSTSGSSPYRKSLVQAGLMSSSSSSESTRIVDKRQILPSSSIISTPLSPQASSPKFTSTNELDVFLDDMNHNELRTVAAGHPIGDFFRQAKLDQPLVSPAAAPRQSEPHHQSQDPKAQSSIATSETSRQIYSECALILQRTFVKNIDDSKHQLVPFGKTEQACISYKHIDKAIEEAKHKLKFRELTKKRKKQAMTLQRPIPPFEVIHSSLEPPEDLIAAIGEINMAATQIIADQFDLSNDELLNGLPLIDMSKTKFWPICPLLVKGQEIKCELSRFRTHTGHCNNLKHPTWGAAMTPFARYLPPVHPDGIWVPRKSIVTEMTFDFSRVPPPPPPPPPVGLHSHLKPIFEHEGPHFRGGHQQEMAAAGSVQFVQHAQQPTNRLDLAIGQSAHSSILHQPLDGLVPSIMDGEKIIDSHFQRINGKPGASAGVPLEASSSQNDHSLDRRKTRRVGMPSELPSARLVTSIIHRDVDLPSHDFSILFMSWGQMLDHDMTRASQSPSSIKCCGPNDQPKHRLCLPIPVPPNDPLYSKFNVQCLEFRRSLAGIRPNCVLGPRVHQNAITAPIDANFVYGSSQAHANDLRLFKGGRLRDRDWFRPEGLKPLLPAQDVDPDLECIARPKDLFCFLAGDVRANEQTHLTVLHTLYMREHNRMADKLAELNPHWNDERIYQETRHIMAAGVQHVMINEYVPLLIGKKMAELYNLTATAGDHHHHHHHHHLQKKHYWHGYDPTVTTSVSNSFAAAAFRFGHTFVQGTVERYNKFHEFVASERLRHLFKQPFLLYKPGVMDELIGGMINQASQNYDPFVSEDISGHLFQPPDQQIGHDLPAINLQRGREQGLPGYNLFREWCGLPRAETFEQLEPYLTNHTAYHYSRLYKHVDDIDLWSGGVSERKLPGAAIGPTFACIIARQFSNTRRGDRFWFENPNLPSSFTPEQLDQIRKISLAKILCLNSDDLATIQHWALRMPHPVLNPRVPCEQLPEIDLHFWQEE